MRISLYQIQRLIFVVLMAWIASPIENSSYQFIDYLNHYVFVIVFFSTAALVWNSAGYTGRVFSLLFFIAYVLRVNLVISDNSVFNRGGLFSTGDFVICSESLAQYFFVSISGLVLIYLGSILSSKLHRPTPVADIEYRFNYSLVAKLFRCFIVAKICLIALNGILSISVSGVSPPQFPFKAVGIFILFNNYFLPFGLAAMILVLFRVTFIMFSTKIFYAFSLIGLGLLESLISHSKISIILLLFPLLLATLVINEADFSDIRKSRYIFFMLIPLFIFLYLYIDIFRASDVGPLNFAEITFQLFSVDDGLRYVLDGISARLTGGSELMGVLSYPGSYEFVWLKLMYSNEFLLYLFPDVLYSIYGVQVGVDGDGVFIGKSIGLFGIFFLDKSFLLYFLACFSVGCVIRIHENAFIKKAGSSISFTFVAFVSLNLMESGFDILPIQYFALLILAILFGKYLTPKATRS